jgi:hypothetical protein
MIYFSELLIALCFAVFILYMAIEAIRVRHGEKRRFEVRFWLFALFVVLVFVCPASAQQPAASAADITFSLKDSSRSATWPVAVREVTIDGKPIRLDHPVHVQGSWLRTVTITLRNISPKIIVSGGIGLVFPESGDGSPAHPYGACWSKQHGRVPKIVYLASDGYHLPPDYDLQKPLSFAPGTDLRLTFTTCGDDAQAQLADRLIRRASLTFETFYFADNSRWGAQQYALPPLPGTRQWRMVTPDEFLHSAHAGQQP